MADDALMLLPPSARLTAAEKRAIAASQASAGKASEQVQAEAQGAIRLPAWHPHCARCNRPVDRLEFTCDPGSHHVRVSIVCHGAPGQPTQWGTPKGAAA